MSSRRKPGSQLQCTVSPVEFAGHEHTFPLKFEPTSTHAVQVVRVVMHTEQGKVQGVHWYTEDMSSRR